jgi:hypothetical protein
VEVLLQYLDDLDDFVGMFALAAERIRRAVKALALLCVTVAVQLLGVVLALTQPPLALAVVSLLAVGMLYRAAVSHTIRAVTPTDASWGSSAQVAIEAR